MSSAVYAGYLGHRRVGEVSHTFGYRVLFAYLDLDDLDRTREQLPAAGRPWAPVRFERSDHLGPVQLPLAEAVRRLVAERTGARPMGPIGLLTQLRTLGWLFNPISVYWCFEPDGQRVRTVVLDVSNTPWHERHQYVVPVDPDRPPEAVFPKALHVSPFMAMDQTYHLTTTLPAERLHIRLESEQDGQKVFGSGLALRRQPFTSASWCRALAHHPFPTQRVSLGIHTQALRLWRKGVPVVPHPGRGRRIRRPSRARSRPTAW